MSQSELTKAELNSKNNELTNQLRNSRRLYTSLSEVLPGNWVNESHEINPGKIVRSSEPFYIDDEIYYANGDKSYILKNVAFSDEFQTLKFDKYQYKTGATFSQVKLIKIRDSFWYGYEFQPGKLSLIRIYRPETRPVEGMTAFAPEDLASSQRFSQALGELNYLKNRIY